MMLLKRLSLVILGLSLVTQPIQARKTVSTTVIYHDHSNIDLAKAALCTFGIALIGYGIYGLYNYLHVPNQKLIEEAQILLERAQKYQSLTNILLSQQLTDASFIPEQTLSKIANKIGITISINSYIKELSDLERDLAAKVCKINKRAGKLNRKLNRFNGTCSNSIEDQRLLNIMGNMEFATEPALRDLNLLLRCLNKHASYLELFQDFILFSHKYYLEIYALDTDQPHNLKQLARAAIASEDVLYPLLQYSRMLKNDTNCLALDLNNLRCHYPTITNQAQTLRDRMGQVYRLIVGDSDYVTEQNARREAEQREERLRIERERLELQRARFLAEISNRPAQSTVIIHNH
ncbi:MAG TPA: hypothetical protein VJJ81_02405 [Candidatus Babeliales bacterium]|nr:hypothetical protein [Candidatus Babeliales bacterium]